MSQAPDRPGPPSPPGGSPSRLPAVIIAGALALTVAAIVTVVLLSQRVQTGSTGADVGPLAVPAAPAPGADSRSCAIVAEALPDRLAELPRRTLRNPQPGVAAWGDPAVILRCGLADPAELTCHAALTQFTDASGGAVAWLQLSDPSAVTYIAVDRPVRIAVTIPPGTGVGPVQQLSELIAADLPARPVCTNGTVTPPDNG